MLSNTLNLSNKCLFLDFFCIEYRWFKKHAPLPKDFFSENIITKSIKTEFRQSELCFVDYRIFLSNDCLPRTIEKLTAPNTNTIASENSKNYIDSKIIRNASPIKVVSTGLFFVNFTSVSPYHFTIDGIDKQRKSLLYKNLAKRF